MSWLPRVLHPIAALVLAACIAAPLGAQAAPTGSTPPAATSALERELTRRFQQRLDSIAANTPGVVGIAVRDLTTDAVFAVNDTIAFPQASAIKIAVLLELVRQADTGELSLDERVVQGTASQVGGSGVLLHFADGGSALSLHDLAVLMIVLSDNTATNILIERVGMERVNQTLDGLGLHGIRLRRLMIRPQESAAGNENVATPRDATRLMTLLGRCELPMSRESCDTMRGILELPKNGPLAGVTPGDVPVAWKPGSLQGVSTSWALVRLRGRPYALAAMVTFGDARAGDAVREVARAAHDHFGMLAASSPYGVRVPAALLGPTDSLGVRRP